MKCEYCGGNMDLEQKVCPYCGQLNRNAQQHIEDMLRYEGQFENTRADVYSKTRKFSDLMVRIVVVAVLFVFVIIAAVVRSRSYDLHSYLVKASNKRHKTEIAQEMEQYLENEDFLEFMSYCDKQHYYGYLEGLEEYSYVYRTASYYSYFYNELMRQTFPAGYYAEEEAAYDRLGDYLDDFYHSLDNSSYYDLTEEQLARTQKHQQKMQEYVEALLIAYCHLSKEDAAKLREMTKARRVVLIEEGMSHAD